MTQKNLRFRGFTLVELLIVIALISILSVAVLATINPIEQTNKARDAKFKNDAAEVLSAYERYYASQNAYPWNMAPTAIGTSVASGTKIAIGGTDPLFGVVSVTVAGVGYTGALISTSELKSAFSGKEPFTLASTPPEINRMYTYHNGVDNNYVCYHPKANANRTGAVAATLKCLQMGIDNNALLLDLGDVGCVAETDWSGTLVVSATRANLVCVPEGTVN